MSMYDDDDDRNDGAHLGFPDTWIEWFCRRRGYEWLCEVELAFIGASKSLRGGGACARVQHPLPPAAHCAYPRCIHALQRTRSTCTA